MKFNFLSYSGNRRRSKLNQTSELLHLNEFSVVWVNSLSIWFFCYGCAIRPTHTARWPSLGFVCQFVLTVKESTSFQKTSLSSIKMSNRLRIDWVWFMRICTPIAYWSLHIYVNHLHSDAGVSSYTVEWSWQVTLLEVVVFLSIGFSNGLVKCCHFYYLVSNESIKRLLKCHVELDMRCFCN